MMMLPPATLDEQLTALWPLVLSATRSVLRSPQDAEEAANDALLRLSKHWLRFDPTRGSRATWAFYVAKHIAIDYYRSARSHQRAIDRMPYSVPDVSDPERLACDRLTAQEALGRLRPHEQRQAQWQADGWTFADLGIKWDVSPNTLKARTQGWRTRLRREGA
jgi:RNA polymerase sigma-70 factor, ECF subfamily